MRAAKVLTINAIASGLIGLACVLDAHLLAPILLEAPPPVAVLTLRLLGVGLTLFAIGVGLVAIQRETPRTALRVILWADMAWVAATLVLVPMFAAALTGLGLAAVIAVGAAVAVFAAFEAHALRRATALA
ncbi:MAG: hypothetical protein Q7S93_15175 [Phenylobacterium sp.]|uniref:hypothetical protein n=1 Tax=Phenylobacterium sp. TaxID=1871053 RepID=UPI00271E22BF|nr:hypothetical protein [Phenylobacterium sp.]MDO8411394.1 hypothetical protein [Phenylobacterium sp.]